MQETRVWSLVRNIPGEGNGYPLQYSCLVYPMDRGIWEATVHGVARVGHEETKTKKKRTVWVSFMYILNLCNFFWRNFKLCILLCKCIVRNVKKMLKAVLCLQSSEAIEKDNIMVEIHFNGFDKNVWKCIFLLGDGIIYILMCKVVYVSINCQLWQGFLLLAASFLPLIS